MALEFVTDFVRADDKGNKDELTGRRDKLLATLAEQMKSVEDAVAGKQFKKSQTKKEKDEHGNAVDVTKELRFIPNYVIGTDGLYYYQVRYGGRRPLIRNSKPVTIKAGKTLKDVLKKIGEIIEATKGGEFDQELMALKVERKPKENAA